MADPVPPPSPKFPSGLQQQSSAQLPSTPLSPPPTLLLGNTPSVRLSSSPASSPHIIESQATRSQSIYPERGSVMAHGNPPGADFLELSSDDDSEWMDDNGTRNFDDLEGLGSRVLAGASGSMEEERGRKRDSKYLTALPPFNPIAAHDSATEELPTPGRRPPSQARQLSVKRYNRANVVHNRGSPRSSLLSNASSDVMPRPLNVSRTVSQNLDNLTDVGCQQSNSTQSTHQRNLSEVESIRMNAFLNAHYATLQAMDSQPNSPLVNQHGFQDPPGRRSLSEARRIKLLAPIQIESDPNRPPYLPAHFIRTPYPFSQKKDFPPPSTRPRRTDTDITPLDHDNTKGMHILGMANPNEYDYRNRLERNIDAQGLIRAPNETINHKSRHERWNSARSTNSARESVVWISLRRNRRGSSVTDHLEQIAIPSNLVASDTKAQLSPVFKPKLRHISIDFDDMYLAQELRSAYRKLAGPWILRALSARQLRCIRLGQVSAWSGSDATPVVHEESGMLLAARGGLVTLSGPSTPFTEHGLLDLYRRPKSGKARYTWVHWARRLAASNHTSQAHPYDETSSENLARDITTIQFAHAFSPFKILSVLVTMLALAVAAAVLYVFLGGSVWRGESGRERAEKVTPGMLIGLLVGVIEGIVFGAWIAGSWMWL